MSIPISRLMVLKERLQSNDDAVIKKTLKELSRVDMTVDMLKETGIGIAVNQLRHHEIFCSMARELVSRWKELANSMDSNDHIRNGYRESSSTTSQSMKRAQISGSSNSGYSSSPSPPPVSKKPRLDNGVRLKSNAEASSKKISKTVRLVDDGQDGNFTAECGSFEQILGLNDTTRRTATSSASKNSPDSKKFSRDTAPKPKNGLMNGDSKSPSKQSRSAVDYGQSSKSVSSSSSSNVDWSKVLPTKLTTEYRPQPQRSMLPDFDDSSSGRRGGAGNDDGDEVDFSDIKRKGMTRIYSGRRKEFLKHVPTLFDSCINVLCDNIDALGYTGGVPFDILKPVLDRATAAQLYRIEEWNPYLIEDTGDLWKGHCKKDFKNVEPDWEESETWRELYERMLAERDKKLNQLKQVISEQQAAKESAVRQAKMALAKAPRDVRRRQVKYGTFKKEVQLPGAEEIVQSRRNLDSHPGDRSKVAQRAFSHIYEEEKRQKDQPKNRKAKVPPLMAKSLKMMKVAKSRF